MSGLAQLFGLPPKNRLSDSVSDAIQLISRVSPRPVGLRNPRQALEECQPSSSARLHSAPKGLLRHYILHKIAQHPLHGYEVIQDIESRTEGAWRPGAGSRSEERRVGKECR